MIDLSTCVPGQQVKYLCGEYGEYIGPTDGDFPQFRTKKDSGMPFRHTQSGSVPTGGYSHPYDVVKIFPLEPPAEQPMIDLSTCVPGQRVRYLNNAIGTFVGPNGKGEGFFPVLVKTEKGSIVSHTKNGKIYHSHLNHPHDIIEILPIKPPEEQPMIDLSTCAYGQKVKYRNGDTGMFVRPNFSGGIYTFLTRLASGGMHSHTQAGFTDSNYGNPHDILEILPVETPAEPPMIDLSTCATYQKVRFANGKIGKVGNSFTRIGSLKVRTVQSGDIGWWWYTLDGKDRDLRGPEWRIVEILPLEIPEEPPMPEPTPTPQEMDYKSAYLQIANIISVAFPECEVTTVDMARLLVNENRTLRLALGLPTYEEVEDLTYTEVYG